MDGIDQQQRDIRSWGNPPIFPRAVSGEGVIISELPTVVLPAAEESSANDCRIPLDDAGCPRRPIRVAIFDTSGASNGNTGGGAANIANALCRDCWPICSADCTGDHTHLTEHTFLTPNLIRTGQLAHFDVLAVPGGKSVEQSKSLGVAGRSAVCHFVANGGGYLGICAGAFLATSHHDPFPAWQAQKMGLGILRAGTLRPKDPHVVAGHLNVRLQLTGVGRRLLWDEGASCEEEQWEEEGGRVLVRYQGGPMLCHPQACESSSDEEEESEEEEEEIPAWVLTLSDKLRCTEPVEDPPELDIAEDDDERIEREAVYAQYKAEFSTPSRTTRIIRKANATLELEEEQARQAVFAQYKAEFGTPSKTTLIIEQINRESELEPGTVHYDDSKLPTTVPPFQVLAQFAAETEEERQGLGGSVAIAHSKYGNGSVVCISPHPESTFDWGPSRRKEVRLKKDESGIGNARSIPRQRRIVQRSVLLLATKDGAIDNGCI